MYVQTLQCSHISVCLCVCVSFSSSWLACLLMFGHMLSFISLRHQSCWPAVRTAALSVPLLLYFSLSLYQLLWLYLSVSFFLSVCFCRSASHAFSSLFFFNITIFLAFSLFLYYLSVFLSFQLLPILFFSFFLSFFPLSDAVGSAAEVTPLT